MAFFQAFSWHEGETAIRKRTRIDFREDNPTSPFLTPRAAHQAQRYPLIAIGTLDEDDRPWCTIWGSGEPPIAQPVAQSVLGIRTNVDATFDPVVEAIWKGKDDGEVMREEGQGRMMAGLSIHLEERGRVKLAGRIIAGALCAHPQPEGHAEDTDETQSGKSGQIQLVVKIDQSLGNCPKYLNRKKITSSRPKPRLRSSSPHLSQKAIDLIHKADLFFLASAHEREDMDVNHRGGPPGFVRVEQPSHIDEGSAIVWPEYSGNNLYQTLGNLETTPHAGLVIPDFDTGDVLYVSGDTETLVGAAASSVIARSSLAVRLKVTATRFVEDGLPFRGTLMDDASLGRSPYNPRVRFLASEKKDAFAKATPGEDAPTTAQLVRKTKLTPTITRYRAALSDPSVFGPWKPGQYVAMDFAAELDMGYSHMRDDNPTNLNDDYIRTFTVSSTPDSLGEHGEEFEITVRKVGHVTSWLELQREGTCDIGIRGFGGEFWFNQPSPGRLNGFIAAGIGITPLLGQMGSLDLQSLKVWWSIGIKDVGLPLDILTQYPALKDCMIIYLTGDDSLLEDDDGKAGKSKLQAFMDMGAKIERRRIQQSDLTGEAEQVENWYLCTAPAMRKVVQDWMPGKTLVYENFDY
ncbi:uncharacterized protein Z518_07505 [Rhinocladiella mackenziei CBS 650.93]|uniref:FAD-binding FR-type domain-containing protein n=1 Tax=Rhinocladiella mackenziei CBS 650.93 TaxID=1442369 RepID=A0A0D2FPA0_9EURO|nr:uncharacterized protein Z518_07505 [Rhinocladiella mackenziei CBS 650.93]KIX03952.1 hypothetical protein Z518_07505 [Rhinocladiella mackenziei CBS 650.93]